MTRNINEVEAYYRQRNEYPLFCLMYVCAECKYRVTCTGLNNDVRASCTSYVPKSGEELDASSKWGEMSYWRVK